MPNSWGNKSVNERCVIGVDVQIDATEFLQCHQSDYVRLVGIVIEASAFEDLEIAQLN